jgi:hypothetical protein
VTRRWLVVLVLVAGCASGGTAKTAATTTSTTTLADPAATASRQAHFNVEARPKDDPALEELTLSRDSRIMAAARDIERILQDRELEDTIPPDADLEYANAVLELARACKAAGYLS